MASRRSAIRTTVIAVAREHDLRIERRVSDFGER